MVSSAKALSRANGLRIVAIGYDRHPSMRLRVQQYEQDLQSEGCSLTTVLLPQAGAGRPQAYARGIWRAVAGADVVLVQRVLFGWLNALLRASRKPVVFDLDDLVQYIRPTQLEATEQPRSVKDRARVIYRQLARGSRYYSSRRRPLEQMLSLSRAAILGNRSLQKEVAPYALCPTVVLPTCVPTHRAERKKHEARRPVTLGWVGTRDNVLHLRTLEPVFSALRERFGDDLKLQVVTSQEYRSNFLRTEFTPWSLKSERDVVSTFDIGIMPLVDDPYSRGKCAFKAILCMSYGVPVVISPVGLNAELVKHGWNGFLASTSAEWAEGIARLVEDHELRAQLGSNAFRTIENGFSTARAYPILKSVLERVARGEALEDSSAQGSSAVI
jgi:glycosyltransferase involved in cell wall biosynthesis